MKWLLRLGVLLIVMVVAACAPDSLDMTPTAVPPTAIPTAEPGAAPTVVVVAPERQMVDQLVAATPPTFDVTSLKWILDKGVPIAYSNPRGGSSAKISYKESGGGQLEISWVVFPSADKAKEQFDAITKSINDQGQTKLAENPAFPMPNNFGSGTYGHNALFLMDNVFIRISVPRISSNVRDPITPLVEPVLAIFKSVKGS